MKLTGNLQHIKSKRDTRNQEIELHIDRVEYITHKKDGKYYQAYEYIEELETPLIITGDCLARLPEKHPEEGSFTFQVFDKTDNGYEPNPNKELSATMEYDFDADLQILTSVTYIVTLAPEEFQQVKSEAAQRRKQQKGKKNR